MNPTNIRFLCSKTLQDTEKCDDFEARFCCESSKEASSTTSMEVLTTSMVSMPVTSKPTFNDKLDSEELAKIKIKDLRKLNSKE